MWILMGLCLILLGICTYTDIRKREVMLSLPLLIFLLGLVYRGVRGVWWLGVTELFLRLAPGFFLLTIRLVKRDWIGEGDILLVLVCGYILGAEAILQTVAAASLLGGCYGGLALILRKCKRQDTLPFVPFLLGACLCVCVLWIFRGKLTI